MKIRKVVKTAKKHYLFFLFILGVLFVGTFIVSKALFSKPTYVYVKVKMGQGLWWASTAKPNIWYASSFKKGDIKYSISGRPEAQIVSVKKYPSLTPSWISNQYDVYVVLKLAAGSNRKTGEYSFNRGVLSVGSSFSLQFPRAELTGTIVDLSPSQFRESYIEKDVYLIYQGGYNKDFSYRYDSIKVGSTYSDGEDEVVRIMEKSLEKNIWPVANNFTGEIYEREIESTQNIIVKIRVKLKEKPEGLFYGEDYKVVPNASVPFATDDYYFENFQIRKIE